MASPKIKHTKIMRIINDNAVRGHLSKNYLTRKFITRNICDAKYSRFTVYRCLIQRYKLSLLYRSTMPILKKITGITADAQSKELCPHAQLAVAMYSMSSSCK